MSINNGVLTYDEFLDFLSDRNFYVDDTKYTGQDLHCLRDSSELDLSRFYQSGVPGWHVISYMIHPTNPLKATNTSNIYSFNNITLDSTTGIVKADPITPAPANPSGYLRNFLVNVIIEVEFQNKNDPSTTTTELFNDDIRIHVHQSVSKLWLSPTPFSMWKDTNYKTKLHVHAIYDDEVMADISCQTEVTWSIKSSFNNDFAVDANGWVSPKNTSMSNGLKQAAVKATYYTLNAEADINVKDALTGTNKPKFELVSGPGLSKRDEYLNLVILSDGFTPSGIVVPDQEAAFNTLVTELIDKTKWSSSVAPWNSLISQINIWKYFLPSSSPRGGSFICEYVPLLEQSSAFAGLSFTEYVRMVNDYLQFVNGRSQVSSTIVTYINNTGKVPGNPLTTPPLNNATALNPQTQLNLSGLIAIVGMPTQADIDITLSNKATFWDSFFKIGTLGSFSAAVRSDLYDFWRILAFRYFIEKEDTPFAVTVGKKPKSGTFDDYLINIDSYRMSRAYINSILSNAIDSKNSTPIGYLWNKTTNGKDAGNVVLLSRVQVDHRGNTHYLDPDGGYFVVSAYDSGAQGVSVDLNAATSQFALRTFPPPVLATETQFQFTFLHEMGHLIVKLFDEYGGAIAMTDVNQDIYKKTEDTFGQLVNTQLKRELLSGTQFKGNQIKWRWLRYEMAAVLAGPASPVPNTSNFEAQFSSGFLSILSQGDHIFLRKRKLIPVDITNQTPSPLYSCPLQVVSTDSVTGKVVFTKVNAGDTFDPLAYPKGDLLVKPVPDPFDNTKYAELISSKIQEEITSSNRPFNTVDPNNTGGVQNPWLDIFIPGGLIDTVELPTDPPKLGGLYYGGNKSDDNIFHPFGFCVMRNASVAATLANNNYSSNYMCPVCKYLCAEMIDPSYHFSADVSYNTSYPKPKT